MIKAIVSDSSKIVYPDSDGQPMADNTKQFRWIVVIKENLELLFANRVDVFVAGDLLWYPVEGDNKTRQAPDTMVVIGRPKGERGSYRQWQEENIPPQVVFEILSPGNRLSEMTKKFKFYERYGVEEYYIYDPDKNELEGWLRSQEELKKIESINDWISPRLGIKFSLTPVTLEIYSPQGNQFLTFVEIAQLREQEKQQKELAQQQAEQERQRADEAMAQLEKERQRIQALETKLRELGIELDNNEKTHKIKG